uniref:Uncharacterized protein n=1 Tax=viral metagenome TaxID=1070528 RepID=A0A6C0KP93_9ZZZZ
MFDFFKEITIGQADLIKSFAIFYLLIVSNYVSSSLFTCAEVNFIEKNTWLKLAIAFFLFYFLVTLISNTGKLEFTPPIQKFIYSFYYFIGFLILMRLDIFISSIVILLIFVIYFLESNKDFYLDTEDSITNPKDKEIFINNKYWITTDWPFKVRLFPVKTKDFLIINKLERLFYYIIIFLLLIGFISYGGEIRETLKHSKNLTWIKVITDTKICKLKDRKSFWHYFRVGLGLKI